MKELDILKLIQPMWNDRSNYSGEKQIDEILKADEDVVYLVTRENLPSLHSESWKEKKKILFDTYHIYGIFGLLNPKIRVKEMNLMLLVLKKQSASMILAGIYNKGAYHSRSYRKGLHDDSLPLEDRYPLSFIEYCKKIEFWVSDGIMPTDGQEYSFNQVNSSDMDKNRIHPQRYSKAAYKIAQLLQKENTVPLSSMASIIRVNSICKEKVKVINYNNLDYPLSHECLDEGYKTDTQIYKGDIICNSGSPDRLYFLIDDINEEVYANSNDFVIRPHKKGEAAYIYTYLQSDTGKSIMSANSTGTHLLRMTLSDWEQVPIIIPKKPLEYYEKFLRLQYYQQKTTSEYNKFLGSISHIEEAQGIEDILDIELLKRAQLFKADVVMNFLEEDFKELNSCFRANAFKAVLILCGSILEAVLIDWVSEKQGMNYFENELYVQDRNGRSKRADLIDYINIIEEIERPAWMEESAKAHTIRQKRNLVHAKLCLKSDVINETVCREVIGYLKDVLRTRGIILF